MSAEAIATLLIAGYEQAVAEAGLTERFKIERWITHYDQPKVQGRYGMDHPYTIVPGHALESPNPYYGKTTSGFMLEWYYSLPLYIHTPEGKVHILGTPCTIPPHEVVERMMVLWTESLGLTLAQKMIYTTGATGGQVGPFYYVTKAGDLALPEPVSPQIKGTELRDDIKQELIVDHLRYLISSPEARAALKEKHV